MTNKRNFLLNFLLVILCAGALLLTAWLIASSRSFYLNSDFFTFWLGGHMTAYGQNVYDPHLWAAGHTLYGSTWLENPQYCYPLYTALLFIPLGIISLKSAAVIWAFFSLLMITASLILLLHIGSNFPWKIYILPALAAAIIYRPAFTILFHGQIDGLLLLFIVLALRQIEQKHALRAGIFLSFLIIKPNIGIPLLGFYSLLLLIRGKWKTIIPIAVSCLAIVAITWIVDPTWLSSFIRISFYKADDPNLFPTLHGIAALISGWNPGATRWIWAVSSILLIGVIYAVLLKRLYLTDTEILALLIPLVLLITPYLRTYDLLLLEIPLMLILKKWSAKGVRFSAISSALLGFSILSLLLLFLANSIGHDIWSSLLTFLVMGAYLITFNTEQISVKAPVEKVHPM